MIKNAIMRKYVKKTDMMMNNDTFYKEMTQKAYEEYMNNYTWKSVAKKNY